MPTKRKDKSYHYIPRYWLGNLRDECHLTQPEVAAAMGVSVPKYSQIENGVAGKNMNAPKLVALARIFGKELEYICFLEIQYLEKLKARNSKKPKEEDNVD